MTHPGKARRWPPPYSGILVPPWTPFPPPPPPRHSAPPRKKSRLSERLPRSPGCSSLLPEVHKPRRSSSPSPSPSSFSSGSSSSDGVFSRSVLLQWIEGTEEQGRDLREEGGREGELRCSSQLSWDGQGKELDLSWDEHKGEEELSWNDQKESDLSWKEEKDEELVTLEE